MDEQMSNILMQLDNVICRYLGLKNIEIIPHFLAKNGEELMVVTTETCKRHVQNTPVTDVDMNMIKEEDKRKLGVAIGKVIASNLVVSFDDVTIKGERPCVTMH